MIPKIIHLCWFGPDPFPVEIKICLASWKRIVPDYKIRLWNYDDAKAIGCRYIDDALAAKRWAFAADAVRFYAVYTEGGVYMDSDVYLYRRFDDIIPEHGFVTVNEKWPHMTERWPLQAAFFIGEKGNKFCKDVYEYYQNTPYWNPDGSVNEKISPDVMLDAALKYGYTFKDEFQDLGELKVYPAYYISPRKKYKKHPNAIGQHKIFGAGWRKHKLGRRIERKFWNILKNIRFFIIRR